MKTMPAASRCIRVLLQLAAVLASTLFSVAAMAQAGFSPEIRITNIAGPSVTPMLAANAATPGLLHAVWTEYPGAGTQSVTYYSRTTNNGTTWSSPIPISLTPTSVVPVVGAGNNSVYVIWTDAVATGELYFRASTDGGVTWASQQQLTSAPSYSRPSGVFVDSAGCVHVTWFDGRATGGNGGQNYHRMSCDGGGTFSAEFNLSVYDPGVDNESPRMSEGADGTLYIVFRGSRDGVPQQGWPPLDEYLLRSASVVRTGGAGAWRVNWMFPAQRISRGLPESRGNTYGAQIFAGNGGRMHVAYWDETNGNNLVYRSGYPKGAGFGPVIDLSQYGSNHLEFDGATADVGGFGIGEDAFNNVHVAFGENNHVREGFQVGRLYYRRSNDGGITFGPRQQVGTPLETMQVQAMYHNGRFHVIWSDFRDSNQGAEIYYRNIAANGVASPIFLSTTALTFPTTAINTSSAPQAVTVTNTDVVAVPITGISISGPYTQTNNCPASLAAGASCIVTVTFSPTLIGSTSGTLSITFTGTGSPATVALSGFASALSLVDHYYQSILGRPADASGKAYWEGEAARMQALGVDVKEAYMVMAGYFFSSAEYLAKNSSDSQYVTDLYQTFFNRAPDASGLGYWTGQLASGLPRSIVMYGFLFAPEFGQFMTGLFGNTTSRAEVYIVMDFFRGVLNRLPDSAGYAYWLGQFRAAQCAGAGSVYAAANSISAQFLYGSEYLGRGRTSSEYASDLYYAFLRRGGDLPGVSYWINRLNSAIETREQLRVDFINTPEFSARVNAVIAQGCYTGP
jgi:hypothetical protein